MNYKISIITVVLNAKDYLETTLNSIRGQSYDNVEIIIVDGLSKDGTLDVINKNQDVISNWISEKDEGLYYAMNKGLTLATGDYALFMNAGDEFCGTNVIKTIADNIKDPETVYFGNTYIYNGNVNFIAEPLNKDSDTSQYLPHHQSIFYPKSFYKSHIYDTSFRVCADGYYTYQACAEKKIQYLDLMIIRTFLDGFGISQYGTIKGMRKMIKERQDFEKKINTFASISKLKIIISHLIKYFSIVFGGNKGAIVLMKINRSISKIIGISLYK
jgi:putative colanic acid biosynthesis glycosyltransferase